MPPSPHPRWPHALRYKFFALFSANYLQVLFTSTTFVTDKRNKNHNSRKFPTKNNIMNTQEIKEMLLDGQQFSNEQADWFTLSSPENGRRIIVIGGEYRFYKTLDSYAKRIFQLTNRGY